jgi:hypothetical protein
MILVARSTQDRAWPPGVRTGWTSLFEAPARPCSIGRTTARNSTQLRISGPRARAGQEPWLEGQTGSTSSCAAPKPAPAEGLEWRVDGLLPAGRPADVKPGRSVLGAESAECLRPGSDNALYQKP